MGRIRICFYTDPTMRTHADPDIFFRPVFNSLRFRLTPFRSICRIRAKGLPNPGLDPRQDRVMLTKNPYLQICTFYGGLVRFFFKT
jgi:hypothetical protein